MRAAWDGAVRGLGEAPVGVAGLTGEGRGTMSGAMEDGYGVRAGDGSRGGTDVDTTPVK